jgi:PEP-CTERM motif
MKKLTAALMAVGAMGTFGTQTAYAGYIQTVDATTTRDWLQVIDTSRLPLSEFISRCDSVTGTCAGSVTSALGTTTNLTGLIWASTAQVEQLLRSRGGIIADVNVAINLFGDSFTRRVLNVDDSIGNGWIDTDGAGTADEGIFRTSNGGTTLSGWSRNTSPVSGLPGHARISYLALAGTDQIYFPERHDLDSTGSGSFVGAWLFRESRSVVIEPPPPPPTGTVPVPSTLAILGLGLIGLMRARFVKAQ